MDEVDLMLLAAIALGFSAGMVATTRLFRWFVEPVKSRLPGAVTPRWRAPTLIEPS